MNVKKIKVTYDNNETIILAFVCYNVGREYLLYNERQKEKAAARLNTTVENIAIEQPAGYEPWQHLSGKYTAKKEKGYELF